MASSVEFVQYVADQMGAAGDVTYKKMFGEYGLYVNGKIIGLICEDQLFIKKTEAGSAICPELEEASPYKGAKPHFLVEELEDTNLLTEFVMATYEELPMPKPKKPKAKKE